ncbi:MAG: glycosyl transferase [Flavobacteriia bacterium]|nr:MAG: glycosyl transferase [Flavobacteriia bacterium]
MISILIPVYNIDVNPLVEAIYEQIIPLDIPYEIIVIDDCSTEHLPEIKRFYRSKTIKVLKSDVNLGRSSVRNLLVENSHYPWLIFLDADTLPQHHNFISTYIKLIESQPPASVYFGGIAYDAKDKNQHNSLRYTYGINRESKPLAKRQKPHPYSSLLMSNTLIKKEVFEKVKFNDKITLYGHEDAVFAWDLYKAGVVVEHIDNPAYHKGIEPNDVFIAKTKEALENLLVLYRKGVIDVKINKLLRYYERANASYMTGLLAGFYKNRHRQWESWLSVENPSLYSFDLYRLSYFCYLSKNLKQLNR